MIVCIRTVDVPASERGRHLEWINEGRAVRQAHGILATLPDRYPPTTTEDRP